MLSMTGFGRVTCAKDGVSLTVEIKSVNNRYLDVNFKIPRIFAAEEEGMRAAVREKLSRGHADVFVSYSDKRPREKSLAFDENAARAYVNIAKRAAELFPEAANDLTLTSVLRYPEVLKSEDEAGLDDELKALLYEALNAALDNLNAMRRTEGEKLKADMLSRMKEIEKLRAEVATRAPLVAENYRQKLLAKMKKILDGVEVDEARLLTEVAIFSDKSNIDEELTRLNSHISQFREICRDELVGRKLDFLVQEFNRETNTICSKSNDLEVTRLGLAMKNEIEKVREQVQNVE